MLTTSLAYPRRLLTPCRHPTLESAACGDKLVRKQWKRQVDSIPRAPTDEHGGCTSTMRSYSDGSVVVCAVVCAKGREADMWKARSTEHVKICASQRVKPKPTPHSPSAHRCKVIVARQSLKPIQAPPTSAETGRTSQQQTPVS